MEPDLGAPDAEAPELLDHPDWLDGLDCPESEPLALPVEVEGLLALDPEDQPEELLDDGVEDVDGRVELLKPEELLRLPPLEKELRLLLRLPPLDLASVSATGMAIRTAASIRTKVRKRMSVS